MAELPNAPFGVEDGHVVAYQTDCDRLLLEYEFWNEKHGLFIFETFFAVHDNGAVGVTIGSWRVEHTSALLTKVISYQYETPPEAIDLSHYQFLDVDGAPVFEVIAKSCTYSDAGHTGSA